MVLAFVGVPLSLGIFRLLYYAHLIFDKRMSRRQISLFCPNPLRPKMPETSTPATTPAYPFMGAPGYAYDPALASSLIRYAIAYSFGQYCTV